MKKVTATLLTLTLLTQLAPAVSAKPKGDWNAVKALENRSISVETRKGALYYGLLQSAGDDAIVIQLAAEEDFTPHEITVRRDEVRKVWHAKLRFGEKNIAKGAWIGTGLGFVATIATLSAVAGQENADRALGAVWFPVLGAGIGALAGAFWKKKHKKQKLVYSV